jgi:Fe-S protein assembly chaperone HscA
MAIFIGGPAARVNSEVAVGIDLGTTNSLVAWVDANGQPQVLSGADGPLVPSVIAFDTQGELLATGVPADLRVQLDPRHTIYSVKRLMGRDAAEVADELVLLPYQVHATPGSGAVRIQVGERRYTPPELSAFILKELKRRAELALGRPVGKAVITVPAYFGDAQRQATKDAGRLAGLEVLRIVNEPTAAALAYGLDKQPPSHGRGSTVAVFDLGGGTFDISILQLHEGLTEVLSTGGDTHLGGDDIDLAMVGAVVAALRGAGLEPAGQAELLQRLRKAAIMLKIALSSQEVATVSVDLQPLRAQPLELTWTRADFEALVAPIVERTIGPCRRALADAGLQPSDLDQVVLVGGSTRIPLVRQRVAELFGRAPHTEIDPDQVVALGAAVQADIMTTGRRDQLLLDVIPLSLGIETMGGAVAKIIVRNSSIPATASDEFTTSTDNQTGVVVHVVQGERELVRDCRSLARFIIPIDPMPAGLPRLDVQFLVDANGILHVTARDMRTGREKTVEVKPSYGLTDSEVEAMLEAAFDNAERDVEERSFVDQKVEAEQVIAATRRQLHGPAGQRLDSDEAVDIEAAIASVNAAVATGQVEPLRNALNELSSCTLHLAEMGFATAIEAAAKSDKAQYALDHEHDPAAEKPKHHRT